ncbi:MAG: DNA polymerase III subunit beta [Candidatus Sungbacteria bacterium]|uniref:Beta sliding clamp n=1 Tax=Candidatus Sungiibacteriota bacterium TaxID=2750080 RepID=A0A932VS05_9BACT|nr:DNA polymerase III subunit beta [Candidatus Sungbacteria bacterium]
MKFSCLKVNLERALGAAERFTGKNVTLPVLANVLMEIDGSSLVVRATNLEHAVEIRVPGDARALGMVSVPARVVSSLVQATREDKVHLEAKQGNLIVASQSRQSRVNGVNAEEFPLIPKVKNTVSFLAPAGVLAHALSRVLPAVSSSDFKPELGGVFLQADQKNLICAATDTFRLAEETLPLVKGPSGKAEAIVPQRVCQEMTRILPEYGEEEVKLSFGENQMTVEAGSARITSRLIEGVFPDYRAIIPSQFARSVFLPKEEFLASIRSSSIFSSKLQDVALAFSRGSMEIASVNTEVGEYRTTMEAEYTGADGTVSFNYRYLMDGIQALEEDELFLGCGEAASPALLRNKSHASFLYVVMPIRLT